MKRLVVLAVCAACGAHRPPAGELRFQNRDAAWRVAEKPIAEPKPRDYNRTLYHTDGFVVRRATRAMEMRPHVRAQDVNAFDEVPDSSWFENRIGVRDLSLDELRQAANVNPGPFENLPWTITGAKEGGLSVGYVFEDAKGDKYVLKFDFPQEPEMETGAHAVVQRIVWACGYNVPQDYIGYVKRESLIVGAKAKKKGYDDAKLEAALKRVFVTSDGRIRVLASRYLAGKPLGPYAREGTREDDPNDTIPHQNRRSLRGQYAIFSWLNHADIQEDQSLDTYKDGKVTHHVLDFGKALGVAGYHLHWQTPGFTYRVDFGFALENLIFLGLNKREFDGLRPNGHPAIGLYDAEHFDPGSWRTNSPYWPYTDKDRVDAFWGAKIIMRFTREQLEAIVDEGQYSDASSRKYLVDTLVARQRAVARYWFDRTAPLDNFTLEPDTATTARLCFTDLTLAYNLRDIATTYAIDAFDHAGKQLGTEQVLHSMPNGRRCVSNVPIAQTADAYTIVRFRVRRNAKELPEVVVHVAKSPAGDMRIIGLRRR